MATVLVTGAGGFLGSPLCNRLSNDHEVIALSRRPTNRQIWSPTELSADYTNAYAHFASREELQRLNEHHIDVAVHLASEIGGCSEEAALQINVLGTRTLLRYLIERGCKRFVLASSVAAVGCLSESFIPRALPIPDDHPSDAIDAYGMSKALMEELGFYMSRQDGVLELVMFRLGAVIKAGTLSNEEMDLHKVSLPFVEGGGMIALTDAVEAFRRAVDCPVGPGAHRMNLVSNRSVTSLDVPRALSERLGPRATELDLTHYRPADRQRDSLYAVERLKVAYGLQASNGFEDQPAASTES